MITTSVIIVLLTKCVYGSIPPDPCDPLVPEVCNFPFPNDYWLIKDVTGNPLHLNLSSDGLPHDVLGKGINPQDWNERVDGFSPIPAIFLYFDDVSLELSNVARVWNIELSQKLSHPLVLLDAESGERIPVWAELDESNTLNPNKSLMIWPSTRLENSKNYIVAVRNLFNTDNQLILASDAFIKLRDNIASDIEAIEFRRDRYENYIFPILESNNIPRFSLQLAFEFTVQSDNIITSLLLHMRDDAFSRIQNNNVEYTINSIQDKPFPNIARKIIGTMKVAYYLNSKDPSVNVRIVRAENDILTPIFQEMVDVEFEILIPQKLVDCIDSMKSRWLQYGHGLFGNYQQIEDGYLRHYANEYGYIVGSTNWLGFSSDNFDAIVELVSSDVSNFAMLVDRNQQGMINNLFLMKLMLSSAFIADQVFVFDSRSVLSFPYHRNFYGNSMGGHLGTTYMSLTDDIERAVLGHGAPLDLLLFRSSNFAPLYNILTLRYQNQASGVTFLMSLIQLIWNAVSPSGYIQHVMDDIFPDTPKHQIMIHYSLGDTQVWFAGVQTLARSADCVMYESQVAEGPNINEIIFGFDFIDDSETIDEGCLVQGWYYNTPPVSSINVPNNPLYETHFFTRHNADVQYANYEFFRDGTIINPCDGACDYPFPALTFDKSNSSGDSICQYYNVFSDNWDFIVIYFCPDIAYNGFDLKKGINKKDIRRTLENIVFMEGHFKVVFSEQFGIGLKVNNIGSSKNNKLSYCVEANSIGDPGKVDSGQYCLNKLNLNCGQNFITVANICNAFTDLLVNNDHDRCGEKSPYERMNRNGQKKKQTKKQKKNHQSYSRLHGANTVGIELDDVETKQSNVHVEISLSLSTFVLENLWGITIVFAMFIVCCCWMKNHFKTTK